MLHVDLLIQEKRRVSFMYFCTHENINVFISTGRKYRFLPVDPPYQAYLIQ